jgi:hypothetical protein
MVPTRDKLLHIERISADPEKREMASALLAEVDSKIGLYRIGEEIEAKQTGAPWKKGTVMAVVYSNNNYYIDEPELVRRPKSPAREIAEKYSCDTETCHPMINGRRAVDVIESAINEYKEMEK